MESLKTQRVSEENLPWAWGDGETLVIYQKVKHASPRASPTMTELSIDYEALFPWLLPSLQLPFLLLSLTEGQIKHQASFIF